MRVMDGLCYLGMVNQKYSVLKEVDELYLWEWVHSVSYKVCFYFDVSWMIQNFSDIIVVATDESCQHLILFKFDLLNQIFQF